MSVQPKPEFISNEPTRELNASGDSVRNADVSVENGQRINPDVVIAALVRALGSFRWLGNNLHNITESPAWFRGFYEAALQDADAALDVVKSYRKPTT